MVYRYGLYPKSRGSTKISETLFDSPWSRKIFFIDCAKDGKTFKEGEEYKVEHLRYQCKDGFMHPIGCKVGDKDLNPGDVLNDKENSSYHECFQ